MSFFSRPWRSPRVLKQTMSAIFVTGGVRRTLQTAWQVARLEGWRGVRQRVELHLQRDVVPHNADYDEWIRRYDALSPGGRAAIDRRIRAFKARPVFSIVMLVKDPLPDLLDQTIRSVRAQLYEWWECCIAEDASASALVRETLRRHATEDTRIKLIPRDVRTPDSIHLNSAITVATGEFIAPLTAGDLLAEHALFWVAEAINARPEAGLIYSDEDRIDLNGRRSNPYFKCDWNPELFLSHDLINGLGVYRADLVREAGALREGFEGAEWYDVALRCIERLQPAQIHHVPRLLYHRRSQAPGPLMNADALIAGERAVNEHLQRRAINASATRHEHGFIRVRYVVPDPTPLVSLIVPTRNGHRLIKQCVESIVSRTRYPDYEILVVDNGSDDPETLRYLEGLRAREIARVLRDDRPFNFSALNNAAVTVARGSIVGLVNNDIEVITPDWLDEMVGFVVQPEVGAVGARLWYPDDTLQHGGIILGVCRHVAGHAHRRLPRGAAGYFFRAEIPQAYTAVTAACLLVRKDVFDQVRGFDDELAVAYNDVDFCLRVRALGYHNVWTPYAELYHHESVSRGREDSPPKAARYWREVEYMRRRWREALNSDPAYNPNLTLDAEDFSLAWPPRIEVLR